MYHNLYYKKILVYEMTCFFKLVPVPSIDFNQYCQSLEPSLIVSCRSFIPQVDFVSIVYGKH